MEGEPDARAGLRVLVQMETYHTYVRPPCNTGATMEWIMLHSLTISKAVIAADSAINDG